MRQERKPEGRGGRGHRATILDKSANGATYDAIGKRYGAARQDVQRFPRSCAAGMKNNVSHRTEGGVDAWPQTFEDVATVEKYLLLTTFTKDGRPKPTAGMGRARRRQAVDHHRRRLVEDQADHTTRRG